MHDSLGNEVIAALLVSATINGVVERWDELTKDHPFPAALLDTRMVYLAVNGPYARAFELSPSALVGKEYATIHRDTDDVLLLLKAVTLGEAPQAGATWTEPKTAMRFLGSRRVLSNGQRPHGAWKER